jgi:hypothetical protein
MIDAVIAHANHYVNSNTNPAGWDVVLEVWDMNELVDAIGDAEDAECAIANCQLCVD